MKTGAQKSSLLVKHSSSIEGSLQAARIMARALAESLPDEERLSLAQSFCRRIVATWWEALTGHDPAFPLRPLFQADVLATLPEPAAASADSIADVASRSAPETAAYAIGLIYTGMLSPAYRSSYGVYYTPPELVERLIDQATNAGTDWATCRVLDPACGGGAFLAPTARRILEELSDVPASLLVQNIAGRLKGFEIDPFAAWLSQVTLDAVMLDVCRKAGRRLPVVVKVCDSLKRSPPRDRFDLVIGNPPYGRVRLEPEERARFKRSLFGHANLYGLFTDLALRHVKPGGVVAYVTPTSFLAGEYFKNLRGLLGRQAPPVAIDFVASRKGVFEDVLQETVLATYRGRAGPTFAQVHEAQPEAGKPLQITDIGRFSVPKQPSEPWLMPRSLEQSDLIGRMSDMPHRLADWGYRVSTGPLVWNRFKDQLCGTYGAERFPLIWAEAITAEGKFVFRANKKNHEPFFRVKEGDDWLITRERCVLLQRTTAKEQSRRLIAAALPTTFLETHKAVIIENHLNMVRPIAKKPLVTVATLAAFLNSAAADQAFRCVSGSVAVSAYELEALPLPDPADLGGLAELVKRRGDRASIDAECARLYSEAGRARA
jgi:adenine-specific DNA-methyltransferase